LGGFISRMYADTQSSIPVLDCYLDVFTDGSHNCQYGRYESAPFDKGVGHLMATSIKEVVQLFEESSIWVWSAMIMKKRVAIYSDQLDEIQKYIRALPLFVAHRRDWSLLRPHVSLDSQSQIDDLLETGVYIFGTTDANVRRRSDLFDILLDISQGSVFIPDQSKDDFVETDVHIELGSSFQEVIQHEHVEDKHVIKALRETNKSLVDQLKEIKVGETLTFDVIQERDWNNPRKTFMYAVASAEGLTSNQ